MGEGDTGVGWVLLIHRCFEENQTISSVFPIPLEVMLGGERSEISRSVTSTIITVAREVEGRHHGIRQLAGDFI